MKVGEVVIEESYYERTRSESVCDVEPDAERAPSTDEDGARAEEDDWDDEIDCMFWADALDEACGDLNDTHHNRALGMRGEQAAARYLSRVGYEILERNWRCPAGEADIIARDDDALVFIEVKTRTDIHKGFPAEAVDAEKRARYEKIAAWYLRCCDMCDVAVRFDVIALLVLTSDRAFMKHYVNAYGVER